MKILFSFFSALALIISPALATPKTGEAVPAFSVKDASGAEVSSEKLKGKIVVLEWHNPECPFVVKHYGSQNMQKLQAYAKSKGAVWITVNSGAPGKQGHTEAANIAALMKDKGMNSAHYIVDSDGTLGKMYDAKTTPHMFVIAADGKLAYMGAIDDKPSFDAKDIDGAKNYVREALDALLAGKPVTTTSTTAYGCSVKY